MAENRPDTAQLDFRRSAKLELYPCGGLLHGTVVESTVPEYAASDVTWVNFWCLPGDYVWVEGPGYTWIIDRGKMTVRN